jgi:hypothetical protein
MSDDPQSELQRSRLLNEQKTLIKAQTHLQQVLSGGVDTNDEMSDVEPKEATDHSAVIGEIKAGRDVKTEAGPAPQTPGTSGCWKRSSWPMPEY